MECCNGSFAGTAKGNGVEFMIARMAACALKGCFYPRHEMAIQWFLTPEAHRPCRKTQVHLRYNVAKEMDEGTKDSDEQWVLYARSDRFPIRSSR